MRTCLRALTSSMGSNARTKEADQLLASDGLFSQIVPAAPVNTTEDTSKFKPHSKAKR